MRNAGILDADEAGMARAHFKAAILARLGHLGRNDSGDIGSPGKR